MGAVGVDKRLQNRHSTRSIGEAVITGTRAHHPPPFNRPPRSHFSFTALNEQYPPYGGGEGGRGRISNPNRKVGPLTRLR